MGRVQLRSSNVVRAPAACQALNETQPPAWGIISLTLAYAPTLSWEDHSDDGRSGGGRLPQQDAPDTVLHALSLLCTVSCLFVSGSLLPMQIPGLQLKIGGKGM